MIFIKTLAALRAPPVALTNCFTFASLATPNAVETTTQLIEAMHPGRSRFVFSPENFRLTSFSSINCLISRLFLL